MEKSNSSEPSFHRREVFTWIATPSNSAIIRSFSYTITRNVEYLPLSATRWAIATREPVAGSDILDMDGDCNTSGCIAVCCDPERMVGKSKDCTPMRDTTRIVLSGTVHYHACIAVVCLGYLHAQQSGKFTVVKCRYTSGLGGSIAICWIIC